MKDGTISPKISVITAVYNNSTYLEQTILSVINQSYKNVEYIVVDGGSTDNTLDIIKKYEDQIDKFISEKDNGISDAMNKGIDLSEGDYLIFIHADDYLIDKDCLSKAVSYMQDNLGIYFFQVYFVSEGERQVSKNHSLWWHTNFKMGSCHQGQLLSKSIFKKLGKFDLIYKINMDYDFVLRCYRAGVSSKSVEFPIAVMRQIGVSACRDWEGIKNRLLEERKIHYAHCNSALLRCVYFFYWFLYLKYRRVKSLYL